LDDIYFAYGGNDEFNKSFLYSPLRIDKYYGLNFRDVTDEDTDRTPEYLLGKNSFISLTLYYGM